MDNPLIYSRANDVPRLEAKKVVDKYAGILAQNSDGKQSLLDVGSGSGDVLIEILVPVLAQGFTRITGSDISPKMVEYSQKCYDSLLGLDFKELDIEAKDLPLEYHEQFDRVTSFFCLHWIKDQKKSLENIYKCLRKNGDCLLVFFSSNSVFDAHKILSSDPRWKLYVKNLNQVVSPLTDHPEVGEEYTSLMKEAGFVDVAVEVKEKSHTYEGIARFKDTMKGVNVFPLPPSEYEAFFDNMCECFNLMGLRKDIPGTKDYRFVMKYQLLVAYARKE